MLALALVFACQAPDPAPVPIQLRLERAPFDSQGRNATLKGPAFTLLAADADGDGDPDLLVNWHVFAPLALWTNEGGRFLRRPDRAWSLPDHERVPLLEAPRRVMLEAIGEREPAGVVVWHSDTGPFWFFAPTGVRAAGATLHVETNRPILKVMGLEPEAYRLRDERFLEVPLLPERSGRPFFLATAEAAIQLKARVEGAELSFRVGADLVELAGPLDFWYRDPHGIAWLDVTGGPAPEAYVTRGALRGRLAPPFDPKHDDFFVAGSAPGEFTRIPVPGDFGRGRAVQWVDPEGDGTLALLVSAKESPNRLLVFDGESGQARDLAPEYGLDARGADAFAWLDLDGDGDEDLVTLDARTGLVCLENDGGRRFRPRDGLGPGLRLAALASPEVQEELEPEGLEDTTRGIDEHDLVLFDLENDGDLDLLVSAWGPRAACHLFTAGPQGFEDGTERAGLAAALGTTQVVLADLDADGLLDLLCLGAQPRLFRNEHGTFVPVALAPDFAGPGLCVGAPGDFDGDGRIDLALAGRELWLARNVGAAAGPWVALDVRRAGRIPIGAQVRVFRADGSVHAARIGSTHRGHLSQSHGPLLLASPEANPVRRVEVTFPGGARRALDVSGPGPLLLELD